MFRFLLIEFFGGHSILLQVKNVTLYTLRQVLFSRYLFKLTLYALRQYCFLDIRLNLHAMLCIRYHMYMHIKCKPSLVQTLFVIQIFISISFKTTAKECY